MARQWRHALEGSAGDVHGKMPSPVARALVANVLVAVVADVERLGRQRLQRRPHALDARGVVVHGSTIFSGRTSTLEYTPASRYGSRSAQAFASASEGNSATMRLPLNPAGPGSSESSAGKGPARRRRPASRNASRRATCAGRASSRAFRESFRSFPMIAYHITSMPLPRGLA